LYPACAVAVQSSCLNDVLPTYMPSIVGVGYTYSSPAGNDSFLLTVGLEWGNGTDAMDSQGVCGMPAPPKPKLFAVCAN
jgi:hypothetical protein